MKFYDIDTEFTFGKYEGKTIQEVFEKDPKYIDFCFNNIDEFYVSPEVLKELRQMDPKFSGPKAEEFDDDLLESYLNETEDIGDFDEAFEEEEIKWDDDDLGLDLDDDFDDYGDSYDEYDDDY
jgi:hypothetical protein